MKKYICFVFIIAGCANILPPSGGPKDLSPPQLVTSSPEAPNVYFKGNKVVLFFNEYIALQNIENIISKYLK